MRGESKTTATTFSVSESLKLSTDKRKGGRGLLDRKSGGRVGDGQEVTEHLVLKISIELLCFVLYYNELRTLINLIN